jgi:hypothetical protein
MADSVLGMLFFSSGLGSGIWGFRLGFKADAIPRVVTCSLWTGWVSQRRLLFHSCRDAKTCFAGKRNASILEPLILRSACGEFILSEVEVVGF